LPVDFDWALVAGGAEHDDGDAFEDGEDGEDFLAVPDCGAAGAEVVEFVADVFQLPAADDFEGETDIADSVGALPALFWSAIPGIADEDI